MSVSSDIVATWARPREVFARQFSAPPHEGRALAVAMGAALMMFVAQWPVLQRRAVLEEVELAPLLGGALMGSVVILPLVLYGLAFLSWAVMRVFGSALTPYQARLALFWSLLAASPAFLLHGLTQGFLGNGPARILVGVLALGAFLRFWWAGLRSART